MLSRRVAVWFELVRFEHTVFALPFAFVGMMLAADGLPAWRVVGWILGAMVGARTAAMAFNRIADLRYDRENPRTARGPLASGAVTVGGAWILFVASAGLFFVSAGMLNPLTLFLSPAALAIVCGYSLTKRFTAGAHLFLGLALGCAPVGGWLAVRPEWHPVPFLLAAAVLLWVAGFDILYACQDVDFDRRAGLRSVPARFGIPAALRIAAGLHIATVGFLVALPFLLDGLGTIYAVGVALVAALLVWEHRLVRPDDLSRLNAAFFTANGLVSILLFVAVALDIVLD